MPKQFILFFLFLAVGFGLWVFMNPISHPTLGESGNSHQNSKWGEEERPQ